MRIDRTVCSMLLWPPAGGRCAYRVPCTAHARCGLPLPPVAGVAYNPEKGTFYLTGKQWPALFEVEIHKVANPLDKHIEDARNSFIVPNTEKVFF